MRDDGGSDQGRVVAEEAVVQSSQSACIFKTEPSVFPGRLNVGCKKKGKPRIMLRFGAHTTKG